MKPLVFVLLAPLLITSEVLPMDRLWSEEDIVTQERPSDAVVLSDGRVVWVKITVDLKENRELAHLWLTDLAGTTRQLTRGTVSDRHPAASPDEKLVAFLSDRPLPGGSSEVKGPQVWVLPLNGGEPYPVTRQPKGVKAFAFRSSERILFLAEDAPDALDRLRTSQKDEARVVEDPQRQPRVRLFEVELSSGNIRRRTTNTSPITSLAVSPNGRWAALQINVSPSFEADGREKPETYLMDLERGTMTRILADRRATPQAFRFTPDSTTLAFTETFSSDPHLEGAGVELLYTLDLITLKVHEVDLAWPRGLASPHAFVPVPNGFWVLLADGVRNRLAFLPSAGKDLPRKDLLPDHVHAFAASPDGEHLALLHSTPTEPPQWWRGQWRGGQLTLGAQLTHLNGHLKGKAHPKVEVIRWVGARDELVEGILYYPLDYREGKRYPLVVMIHGGPAGVDQWAWESSWAYAPQLYVQRGAFVLFPNYHGSSHYGLEWVESIKGRYYELEIPDILRGVDHLIAQGLVDPDRLGVLGWSNGAILTIALTVTTDRFKAAAPGAGDVNWISDYGTCAFGVRFDNSYFGGPPWEKLEVYIEKSPLFRLHRVTTPTLIFFGEQDTAVPTEQGWQHFRALQQVGKAPVRFVLFPGEGHSLAKPAHRLRKLQEELAWFDRYLFSRSPAHNPWRKPGTPLDSLLARAHLTQWKGAYGVPWKGRLIPQTVAVPGMEGTKVGAVEVTRAQWASLNPSIAVPPGDENLPVVGVTAQQALAYCRRLSQLTGKLYRLPTLGEWNQLRGRSQGVGISWEYFLGETPAYDDLEELERLLAPLGGVSRLLQPVGLGDLARGEGETFLFDLKGNAAEWVMEAGQPVLKGGCAACFEDQEPPQALAGFRVVEGPAPEERKE
ncbi:MAG: prolyl oligopeptidase family serine peptidase [Thermoanaerobaculum sp.]|nr:prolyl oligopeptidase family serine peptidase [Thermoanaerobaculum sp.]MDW7968187.1 prolyl oligopeptidase family serine peptidase [Thermoanaerobaculum sp.]